MQKYSVLSSGCVYKKDSLVLQLEHDKPKKVYAYLCLKFVIKKNVGCLYIAVNNLRVA